MIRRRFGLAQCSLVVLSLSVSACSTNVDIPDDPESQSGAGGGETVATNGGSGGDKNPGDDPVQQPGDTLDVASVVDFPAGVTVASPVSAPAGQPGPMGPPLGNGQPPPPNPDALSGGGFRLLQAG
jgi:hypothetical protein